MKATLVMGTIALLFLTACSSSQIYGCWKSIDAPVPMTLMLDSDGKMTMSSPVIDKPAEAGTFEIKGGQLLVHPSIGKDETWTYNLLQNGKTLEIDMPPNARVHFSPCSQ